MTKFMVAVSWMMTHEVGVEAETLESAIKRVEDDEINVDVENDGEYLDDSFEVNHEVSKELNRPRNRMRAIHPGEILREEFRGNDTIRNIADKTGLSVEIVMELMDEQIDVTDEIAEALSKGFGTTKEFWVNLQNSWNLFPSHIIAI